jgi:hypothetical protein
MGLFGIFATLFSGSVYAAESIKDSKFTSVQKEKAIKNGNATYGDGKGNDYLTSTGEKAFVYGGKVYSAKNPNVVLRDLTKEHYESENTKELNEARLNGRKWAYINLPNPKTSRGYSLHKVEVSTGKPYEVSVVVYLNMEINDWDFAFYKKYLNNDRSRNGESIKITRKEFEELGGYLSPTMTPSKYMEEKRKEEEKKFKEWEREIEKAKRGK